MVIAECIEICNIGKTKISHAKICMRNYITFNVSSENKLREFCDEAIRCFELREDNHGYSAAKYVRSRTYSTLNREDTIIIPIKTAENLFNRMDRILKVCQLKVACDNAGFPLTGWF